MKRLLSIICALYLGFLSTGNVVTMNGSKYNTLTAVALATSGQCGENLTWTLDDGTLVISGTGQMYNYSGETMGESASASYPQSNAPWGALLSEIKFIKIDDKVESIGRFAFFGCSAVTDVTIPSSVLSIGKQAFDWCTSLNSLIIKNPSCEIYDDSLTICAGRPAYSLCIIYGYDDSFAQKYARKYNFQFNSIPIVHNSNWQFGRVAKKGTSIIYTAHNNHSSRYFSIYQQDANSGDKLTLFSGDTTSDSTDSLNIVLVGDDVFYVDVSGLNVYNISTHNTVLKYACKQLHISGISEKNNCIILSAGSEDNDWNYALFDISSGKFINASNLEPSYYLTTDDCDLYFATVDEDVSKNGNIFEAKDYYVHIHKVNLLTNVSNEICSVTYADAYGVPVFETAIVYNRKLIFTYGYFDGGTAGIENLNLAIFDLETASISIIGNTGGRTNLEVFELSDNNVYFNGGAYNIESAKFKDLGFSVDSCITHYLLFSDAKPRGNSVYDTDYAKYDTLNQETTILLSQSDLLNDTDPDDAFFDYNCIGSVNGYAVVEITVYSYEEKYNPVGWRPAVVRNEYKILAVDGDEIANEGSESQSLSNDSETAHFQLTTSYMDARMTTRTTSTKVWTSTRATSTQSSTTPAFHSAMANSKYVQYLIPLISDKMPTNRFLSGYSTDKLLRDGIVYISIEDACRLVDATIIDTQNTGAVVVNRATISWSCETSKKPMQFQFVDDNAGEGDYFEAIANNTVGTDTEWRKWTYHRYVDFAVTRKINHEESAVPVVCEDGHLFVSLYDFAYLFGAQIQTMSTNVLDSVQNTVQILRSCGYTISSEQSTSIEQYISSILEPFHDYDYFLVSIAGIPADKLYHEYFGYGNGLQCDFAEYYSSIDLGTANIIRAAQEFGIYDSIKAMWNLDTQFDEQITKVLLYQPNDNNAESTELDMLILGLDTLGIYGDIKDLSGDSSGLVGLIDNPIVEIPSEIGQLELSSFDIVSPIPESVQTYLDYVSTYEQLLNATEDLSSTIDYALIHNPMMLEKMGSEQLEKTKYLLPVVGGTLRGADTVLREKNSVSNLYLSALQVQKVVNSDRWEIYCDAVKEAYTKYKTNLIDTIAVKSVDAYFFGGIPFSETLYDCLQSAQHSDLFETDPFLSDRINISTMDDYVFIQDMVAYSFDNYGYRSDERFLCFQFDLKSSMLAFESLKHNNPDAAKDKISALINLYNESMRLDVNKSFYNSLYKPLSTEKRANLDIIIGNSGVMQVK